MTGRASPLEITLSAAWHAGEIGRELVSTDGGRIEIVHRGAWSHGLGPDFQDAMILFNGRELRAGGVEVHLRTRGWTDHGHHLDARYESVILHVVGQHDGSETRRLDGALVPVVDIGPVSDLPVPDFAQWDWDSVGGDVCAPGSAATNPRALRHILNQLGDNRLAARVARIEARLQSEPPSEILWQELLDGLGFSRNRDPMQALARALPLASLEDLVRATRAGPVVIARGMLLGAGGFLPMSPAETHLSGLTRDDVIALEAAWRDWGTPFREVALKPTRWDLARVRPANHPIPRLLAAASTVAAASTLGGMTAAILAIVADDAGPVPAFRGLTANTPNNGIGVDRAIDVLASGILPFALALAANSGDGALADAAARQWERLAAPAANEVTRRAVRQIAGGAPLGRIGARGAQGLIQLDTALCQPRRCFECPIAALELAVNGEQLECQRRKWTS